MSATDHFHCPICRDGRSFFSDECPHTFPEVDSEVRRLQAEIDRTRVVLDAYAEERNWRYYEDHAYKWYGDLGTDQPWLLARVTLEKRDVE